jgi:UMF1 family MFS transporter
MKRTKLTKQERSWALYDLSSSAITLMLTAIIPLYMKSVAQAGGVADAQSTAHWAFVNSAATLVLAFLAPVIGAIADFRGNKNRIFNVFFTIGIIAIIASVFIDNYIALLIVNLILIFGYNGTYVIYDAFLVDVTPNERMDYVSSFGYGIGYIGSSVPFVISLGFILFQALRP